VLHCKADVESDHRRRDLVWRQGGFSPDLLEGVLDLSGNERPVAAPEARRELSEVLVAGRLSQALQPKAKQPTAVLLLLDVAQALGAPAQAISGRAGLLLSLLGHLGVLPVDTILQQLDEQLILALEVGVEGAPGEAGLCRNLLDARPLEAASQEDALGRVQQPQAGLGLLLLASQHLHDQKAGWLGSGSPAKKKNQISNAITPRTATTNTRSMGSLSRSEPIGSSLKLRFHDVLRIRPRSFSGSIERPLSHDPARSASQ
jgi:hypothetical protein